MNLLDINPQIRFVNDYAPGYTYVEKERIIYDHELMYIMSGDVIMHYGDDICHLRRGDLFHLSPGIPNHIVVDGASGLRMHCIHFDFAPIDEAYRFTAEEYYLHTVLSEDHQEREKLLRTRPNPVPEGFPLPAHITNIPYEVLSPLFEKCYRGFITPSFSGSLKAKAALFEIIGVLTEHLNEKQKTIHPKVSQAMTYIRQNAHLPLTVSSLAERFGLSPKYFGRMFLSCTGRTVNDYLLENRLFAAREMLIGTGSTIEQIALETGFSDAFYFSKCFRSHEGMSPSQYRLLMGAKR